jgi:hypothetical protein
LQITNRSFEVLIDCVNVSHCRIQIRMPKKFLDAAHIRTSTTERRSEVTPPRMHRPRDLPHARALA